MSDEMVKKTQVFLNSTYRGNPLYNVIPEDGCTGWSTIYALTRALQIELKLTATADNFGNQTINTFNSRYPRGVIQQSTSDTSISNVYSIIQGALWCKGYPTGATGITQHFYSGTGKAVKELKTDMGFLNPDSTVTLNVMKSLLSMDQFKTLILSGGTDTIHSIQQELNRTYESMIGIIPCDGVYGRSMNMALIKILQKIGGVARDGIIGEGTKAVCPLLPDTENKLDALKEEEAVHLLRYVLNCNGYDVPYSSPFNEWDNELSQKITEFQTEYALPINGRADLNTWMSLLISKGNTARSALACDCAEQLDEEKVAALVGGGYHYVGRYLTGKVKNASGIRVPKYLTREECSAIFSTNGSGLRIFAIYQDNSPSVEYYNQSQGCEDAFNAIRAAMQLGIPENEIIYFAVDVDMLGYEIITNVIPYFSGIAETFDIMGNPYQIGVYGSRNVCSKVAKTDTPENPGYACSSFVADASSGYSGNMGFPIPSNWAFDQFYEIKSFGYGTGKSFSLDKVAYRGRYAGFQILNAPQDTKTITDKLALAVCLKLLSIFNIRTEANFKVGNTYSFNIGVIEVSYETGFNKEVVIEDGIDILPAINITNGQLDGVTLAAVEAQYNSLTTSLQLDIDQNGKLAFVTAIAEHVGNGNVTITFQITEDTLQICYIVEQIVGKTELSDDTAYAKITFSIKSEDIPTLPMAQALDDMTTLVEQQCTVLGVILLASLFITVGVAVGEGGIIVVTGEAAIELSIEAANIIIELISALKLAQ